MAEHRLEHKRSKPERKNSDLHPTRTINTRRRKQTQKNIPLVKLPEYKPRKKKTPSLTRIAIAQARLENISHKKSSMKKYRGKFRPKSAYEKRLWKTDEKP